MMSRIDSRHWQISTGRHFQNGRHNTANIQHFPISSKFDMWVDNDVPNWFPTLKHFYRSPISKWPPQYCTNSTLSDFNDISYVGRLWCPKMIPDIEKFLPVALFKKGHHNTAQIQHCSISTSWIDSRHWKISTGLHFQNGRHNTAKIQHCSISKVAFNLFLKPVVCGRFGRLHNR
jgi:hypothetical protein